MTISSTARKAGPFSGTGAQTAFPFAFKVFASTDVLVVQTDSTGVETTLTSGYSVALNPDQNASPGGTVTLTTALPVGSLLTIGSSVVATQSTSIPNQGGFYPKVIENALDKLTVLIQQVAGLAGRSLKFPFSDTVTADLPTAQQRANNLLGFDASGNPVAVAPAAQSATALQTLLALFSGASLIGFLQAGVGAVVRTVQDKLRESISVKDFGAVGDGVTDDTAAFTAAIAASNVVFVPPGNYLISGLKINKANFTLQGAGYAQSVLTMTTAAAVAIEVAGVSSVSGLILRNFKLHGNATNLGAIKLGTATNYTAIVSIEDVFIDGFSNAGAGYGYGVQACSVQELNILNVWMQNNKNAFHRPNLGYCTSTKISGKKTYLGASTNNGALIEGQCDDIYISDGVIEGNAKEAIVVTNTAFTSGKGTRIWLKELYFEANLNGGTGQAVNWIVGSNGSNQSHRLVMENCQFASNPNAPAGTKNLLLDYVVGYVGKNVLIPTDVQTTATCSIRFDSNKYPNSGNYLAGYRALLGSIMVTDFVDPALSTDPNQVNFMNAITFPSPPRTVADANTLDDYQERVTGQWVPTAASFGGSITSVAGYYVKVGRIVHFEIIISGTSLSSTWTVSTVTIPFPIASATSCTYFNGSNGTGGSAYIDPGSGKVLLPTIAAANATLVINGTCIASE